MNWTRAADLKSQLQRLWERGEILSSIVSGESYFPRRLQLKSPAAREINDRFDEVRRWVAEIKDLPHCRIVAPEKKHHVFGKNQIPSEVWIDSLDDFAHWLGKKQDLNRFRDIVAVTNREHPELVPWLKRKPLTALDHVSQWQELLTVVSWIKTHPRPSIYIRQIDAPGIHTKFIEENKSLLAELLDLVMPVDTVRREFTGTSNFAARYGFKEKPIRIRFRLLDSCPSLVPMDTGQDITLDAESFSKLCPDVQNVFITENEVNFLAFPATARSMVIFGAGYGFEALGLATWMLHCHVYYWGDIDAHGFAILHSLRSHFPHARSLLMDKETLLRFRHLRSHELEQNQAETLSHLNVPEAAIFRGLKCGTWGDNFRLEQERIDWTFVCHKIDEVTKEQDLSDKTPAVVLRGSDFASLFRPSRCVLRVWLQSNSSPSDDELFDDFLRRQRTVLAARQRSCLAPGLDLGHLSDAERALATTTAITNRVPVITNPLLTVTCKLADTSVQIFGEADFLILEQERYVVRNITLMHKSDAFEHPDVWLQLQLFAWLMSRAGAEAPERLELFTGLGKIEIVPDDSGRSALRALGEILTARQLPMAPYEPVGWTKCSGCIFRTHCFHLAESSHDVALLPVVDQATARALNRAEAGTIPELISKFDQSRLEKLQISTNGKTSRVGKRAAAILAAAKVATTGQAIWLQSPEVPEVKSYVVFDFEGLPPFLEADALVFLWGMQLYGEAQHYHYSIAEDQAQDHRAWLSFIQQSEAVFNNNGDVPFYHWHHYETAMIKRYIAKYGDPNGTASRILRNCCDLLQMVKASVILPIPSYSLKVIERFLGFQRKLREHDGIWAVSTYLKAMDCENEALRCEFLQSIKDYNFEDLQATNSVLDWLKSETLAQRGLQ